MSGSRRASDITEGELRWCIQHSVRQHRVCGSTEAGGLRVGDPSDDAYNALNRLPFTRLALAP
jgi:hypothetical protein